MASSVCCKVLAAITLILLFEPNTAQSPKHYWISFYPTQDVCQRSTESGFWVRDIYHVLFNKTSRRILARTHGVNSYHTNYVSGHYEWHGKWKWETPEVGLGLYLSFMHGRAEIRVNDNPTTNPRYLDADFRKGLPDTGRGSDFSAFFKENPLFGQAVFYYENTKKIIKRFSGTKCAQTGAWIANEGFYKWDDRSNEWTPIYYLPWNTDFYY
ncbi:unnamed protein product [Heligmosomoides polygyrus]|uniref:Conserved secreted protein n=1 Tax=Heligmosomoides polygyrus TaxID=6339 RepID=A0A183FY92_HELPZ|nr:unnamed protein product [Heligmosomoides polygyrus]